MSDEGTPSTEASSTEPSSTEPEDMLDRLAADGPLPGIDDEDDDAASDGGGLDGKMTTPGQNTQDEGTMVIEQMGNRY